MAQLHARASALPGPAPALAPSPFRRLVHHATERPAAAALVQLDQHDVLTRRTWAQVRCDVEEAAAGLMRRGLRHGQVVLSHLAPSVRQVELELAVRAIGAVPVRVAAGASTDELAALTSGCDVRLVVADAGAATRAPVGPSAGTADVLVLDDESWSELRRDGAERLVMDPHAVVRTEAMVDPHDTRPRFLLAAATRPLGVDPGAVPLPPIAPDDVVLGLGDARDALLEAVRECQLASGAVGAYVDPAARPDRSLGAIAPTVVAVDAAGAAAVEAGFRASFAEESWAATIDAAAAGLDDVAAGHAHDPRIRRVWRLQLRALADASEWFGGRLVRVLATDLPPVTGRLLEAARLDVASVDSTDLVVSPLPQKPVSRRGAGSDLAVRRRSHRPAEFSLAVGGPPRSAPPDRSVRRARSGRRPEWADAGAVPCLDDLLYRRSAGTLR